MLDTIEHSIVWRIRDAAGYLGSIIPNMTSAPVARDNEGRHRQWREAMTPQRMNRLSTAHTAIEDGLKHLIRSSGGSYTRTHELGVLLGELRDCNSGVAASLDSAFEAATEFYGTNTQDPDHCHLASLSDYLDMSGCKEQFKRMRYFELESSIDDPALEYVHVEFHYEVLCALDEAIQPLYGPIADRVEYFVRRAFLHSRRVDSLASHGEASKEAYVGWLEEQGTFVEALRRLTATRNAIQDEHANRAAISVCYQLTGSDDLALRTIATALVESGSRTIDLSAEHGEIETRVHRPDGSKNRIVTTPAGDILGFMRQLHTGFWLATDDPHDTSPEWFRTESEARLYLAQLFLVEYPVVTVRGSSSYCVVSPRPLRSPEERERLSVHRINWAGFGADKIWLKLWEPSHDLRAGERIEIGVNPDSALYRSGRISGVVGQDVYIEETELHSSRA